ncbi:hypothetical protein WDU94_009741 [Cyamophila willieti]
MSTNKRTKLYEQLMVSKHCSIYRENVLQSFVCVLSERLAERWRRPIMAVLGWLRARIGVAVVRAASMCVRGARRRWKSGESLLGYEDGMEEWRDSYVRHIHEYE